MAYATEYDGHVTLIIGGQERELDVTFTVESWGTPSSYDDPGDGPEISIVKVTDPESGRDLTEYCRTTRDLWAKEPYYAASFWTIHHAGPRMNPWTDQMWPAYANITLNVRTLMDHVYEQIIWDQIPETPYEAYEFC